MGRFYARDKQAAMGRTVKSQTDSRQTALLFGLGYTARALLSPLRQRGYHIIGTVRTKDKARELSEVLDVDTVVFNGQVSSELKAAISNSHIIVSSVPPSDNNDDPVISALPELASMAAKCEWAGYLSATSVYGDRAGQWAFEDELLRPATQRGRNRVEAELAWLETGLPVHIFRLAGIYGPKLFGQARNTFSRLEMGTAKAIIKPDHVVNRIHVEDIATALIASLECPNPCQVYNIADGHPAPPQDVLDFAADLIGEPRAPKFTLENADISAMARSFYSETKRIDISRAKRELGWVPSFGNYRVGLCEIYRERFGKDAFLLAGHILVPDADLEAVHRELPKHRAATLAETGCLRFDVYPDLQNKNKFHVFEVFTSEAAFRVHKQRMEGTDWVKASANVERFYTVRKA